MRGVRVRVDKVLFDRQAEAAVVVVVEEDGDRSVPIWVGQAEAFSIALAAEKVQLPRPVTHDLILTLLDTLGAGVEWVRVRDLQEGTYYATACVRTEDGASEEIDCRPSDAMAVALRAGCPIYVAEEVFAAASSDTEVSASSDDLSEDYLANLPDEKFGKYKM